MDEYEGRIDGQVVPSPATGDSVGVLVDRYDAAKRDLEVAEEARRARADEVTRLAAAVEGAIGRAINEMTQERDELRQRLHEVEERLNELEATRSQARSDGRTTIPASLLDDTAADIATSTDSLASSFYEPAVTSDDHPQPYLRESGISPDGATYEDAWDEVLKQRAADSTG